MPNRKNHRTPIPTQLEWEDPEPRTRKGSAWEPVARALKAHPGKWACIGRSIPTSIITQINRGQLRCFQPEGHFEAVTRNHSDRWEADVYARYVGEPDAGSE